MANAQTGTSSNGALWLPVYWHKEFMDELQANMCFYDLGEKTIYPVNNGKVAHWVTMANLTASAALSESFDPTEHDLSAGDVSATVSEYGGLVKVSKFLIDTSLASTVSTIYKRIGYNAGDTLDTVIRNTNLTAMTNVRYGLSAVVRGSIDTNTGNDFSVATIRKAVNFFQKAKALPHSGTKYVGIIHPDIQYDLQGDNNWLYAHQYTDKGVDNMYNGEIGELYGVRFIMNQNCLKMTASGSASTDVYQSYFLAKNAFGVCELYQPEIITHDPDYSSELKLRATYGWKAGFATKALTPSAMIRWETGSTLAT